MLAVSTSDGLTLLDASSPSSVIKQLSHPCLSLLTWSPGGEVLFGASKGVIMRLDGDTLVQDIRELPGGKTAELTALAVTEKGSEVVLAQGSKIYVYNMVLKRVTTTLPGHERDARITQIVVSPSGSHYASMTSANVLVHPSTPPHKRATLKAPSSPFTCLVFDPHRRTTLMTGHADGHLRVWNFLRPDAPVHKWKAVQGDIAGICCSPHRKGLCAVAGRDGGVRLVDIEAKGCLQSWTCSVPLTSIAFLASGSALVIGTEHGRLLHQSLRTSEVVSTEIIVDPKGGRIWAIAVPNKNTKDDGMKESLTSNREELKAEKDRPRAKAVPLRERPLNTADVPVISNDLKTTGRALDKSRYMSPRGKGKEPAMIVGGGAFSPVRLGAKVVEAGDISMHFPSPLRRNIAAKEPRRSDPPEQVPLPPSPDLEVIAPPRSPLVTPQVPVLQSHRSSSTVKMLAMPVLPSLAGTPYMPRVTSRRHLASPEDKSSRVITGDDHEKNQTADGKGKKRDKEKKKVVLQTPTPSPPTSPPRAASYNREPGPSTLPQPQASTSRAIIPSPRKRNHSPDGPRETAEQATVRTQPVDMMKAALAGVLMDWRAESARATRNLHLDVLRSARMQRADLRKMMEDYTEEARELRKENEMLRRENERLRRGL